MIVVLLQWKLNRISCIISAGFQNFWCGLDKMRAKPNNHKTRAFFYLSTKTNLCLSKIKDVFTLGLLLPSRAMNVHAPNTSACG